MLFILTDFYLVVWGTSGLNLRIYFHELLINTQGKVQMKNIVFNSVKLYLGIHWRLAPHSDAM